MAMPPEPPDERPAPPPLAFSDLEGGECPRCGTPYEPLQEYCLECGLRLPVERGVIAVLSTAWRRRLPWYPGDWVWIVLLLLVVAALAATVAVLATRDNEKSATSTKVATTESVPVTSGSGTVPTESTPTGTESTPTGTGPPPTESGTVPTTEPPPPPPPPTSGGRSGCSSGPQWRPARRGVGPALAGGGGGGGGSVVGTVPLSVGGGPVPVGVDSVPVGVDSVGTVPLPLVTGTDSVVATLVEVADFSLSRVARTATVAASAATTSKSKTIQTQSPGYQGRRRRQAVESTAMTPRSTGRRSPHSRQYSWYPGDWV